MLGRTADVEEVLRQSGNPRVRPDAEETDFRLPSLLRRRRRVRAFSPPVAFEVAPFGGLNIALTCSQRSETSEKRSGQRRRTAVKEFSQSVAVPTFTVPNTCGHKVLRLLLGNETT